MIDRAASLIVRALNQQLASPETAPEDAAVLMDFGDGSGQAPEAQDKIVVIVANITQDTVTRNLTRSQLPSELRQSPVSLYIHLVVAANFAPDKYARGLNALSRAIEFFQSCPVLTPHNTPGLQAAGIDRLSIEMESLGLDTVSQLWGVLGGRYLPSVVYRVRTVTIDSGAVIDEITPVVGVDRQLTAVDR